MSDRCGIYDLNSYDGRARINIAKENKKNEYSTFYARKFLLKYYKNDYEIEGEAYKNEWLYYYEKYKKFIY